ncbi:hypothetical protein ACLKA6_005100 [Drosophila palustris]
MWQWNNICYSAWHNVVVVVLAHKPSDASTLDGKRTLKEFISGLLYTQHAYNCACPEPQSSPYPTKSRGRDAAATEAAEAAEGQQQVKASTATATIQGYFLDTSVLIN